MKSNLFLNYILLLFACFILFSAGCSSNSDDLIQVNNHIFKIDNNKITQLDTPTSSSSYGVISDIHGDFKSAKYFFSIFKNKQVDGIIILGDSSDFRNDVSDKNEIATIAKLAADTNLPVFILPGNHESKKDYYEALDYVYNDSNNVFDLTKFRTIDFKNVVFISMPGYYLKDYVIDDGFLFDESDYYQLFSFAENTNKTVVILSHSPPKGVSNHSVDFVPNVGNVGSVIFSKVLTSSNWSSLSGHIHESEGNSVNSSGDIIKENSFVLNMYYNVGSAKEGIAGIIYINNSLISYSILRE